MGLGTMGGMGASRVASGVTGLLMGLTGDPRPDDESVGVEDMPSAIALHATRQPREPTEWTAAVMSQWCSCSRYGQTMRGAGKLCVGI